MLFKFSTVDKLFAKNILILLKNYFYYKLLT